MTEKDREFLKYLKGKGWKIGKDEAGDGYAIFELNNCILHSMPRIRKQLGTDYYKAFHCSSVSTYEFSNACSKLMQKMIGNASIISNIFDMKPDVVSTVISDAEFKYIAQKAIEWAKAQDIAKGLEKYRNLPTDCVGVKPLYHLAALAIAREVKCLRYYFESFKKGDRLGFAPYITQEVIERAIKISETDAKLIKK
jgi:hypothetical protein